MKRHKVEKMWVVRFFFIIVFYLLNNRISLLDSSKSVDLNQLI